MEVVPADGDAVEALRRLHVLLRAAGGQSAQQAGLPRSVQAQNQNLGPPRLHRLGLQHRSEPMFALIFISKLLSHLSPQSDLYIS